MGNYLQLFVITATTVGKIMLCAVAGMFASRHFISPEKSEKGLSYISVRILLPCLLFSNLCLSVTVESIRKFYSAPLLACVPLGLGLASSLLFRIILEKKYHALIMLGCTFQNGLTFPLSIVLNLKGISWLDKEALDQAQSYIFLYNIVCSIGLWAVGEPLIAAAKAAEVETEEALARTQEREREQRQDQLRDVSGDIANRSFALPFGEEAMALQGRHSNGTKEGRGGRHVVDVAAGEAVDSTDSTGDSRHDEGSRRQLSGSREGGEEGAARKRSATATEQLAWYKPAKPLDRPLAPPKPALVYTDEHGHIITRDPAEEEAVNPNKCSMGRVGAILVRSFTSPTVLFSLIGIVVSLTPPLRWVATSLLGQSVIGGLAVIGSSAIPLQLLVLGCTIASNKPKDEEPAAAQQGEEAGAAARETAMDDEGEVIVAETHPHRRKSLPAHVSACVSSSSVFIICSVALRMAILPGVCFLIIHLLRTAGLIPNERPFLLSMLVATSSPAAINGSVICSIHSFHSKEYARMIFFMYLCSIVSTAVYLFFDILYLGW